MDSKEKRIVDAAIAFVENQKSESGSDPEGDWLEDCKTSQSHSIPVEFLELVEAVEEYGKGVNENDNQCNEPAG